MVWLAELRVPDSLLRMLRAGWAVPKVETNTFKLYKNVLFFRFTHLDASSQPAEAQPRLGVHR